MKNTLKALLIAIFVTAGIACARSYAAPAGYYQDQKVVYHNNGGAPDATAYFKRMLNNIRNHIDAVDRTTSQFASSTMASASTPFKPP